MPFFVVMLTNFPGDRPRQNVFGPYSDWERAQAFIDRLNISPDAADIHELPCRTVEEAVDLLNAGRER